MCGCRIEELEVVDKIYEPALYGNLDMGEFDFKCKIEWGFGFSDQRLFEGASGLWIIPDVVAGPDGNSHGDGRGMCFEELQRMMPVAAANRTVTKEHEPQVVLEAPDEPLMKHLALWEFVRDAKRVAAMTDDEEKALSKIYDKDGDSDSSDDGSGPGCAAGVGGPPPGALR